MAARSCASKSASNAGRLAANRSKPSLPNRNKTTVATDQQPHGNIATRPRRCMDSVWQVAARRVRKAGVEEHAPGYFNVWGPWGQKQGKTTAKAKIAEHMRKTPPHTYDSSMFRSPSARPPPHAEKHKRSHPETNKKARQIKKRTRNSKKCQFFNMICASREGVLL